MGTISSVQTLFDANSSSRNIVCGTERQIYAIADLNIYISKHHMRLINHASFILIQLNSSKIIQKF